jgi:hypothetical protein
MHTAVDMETSQPRRHVIGIGFIDQDINSHLPSPSLPLPTANYHRQCNSHRCHDEEDGRPAPSITPYYLIFPFPIGFEVPLLD